MNTSCQQFRDNLVDTNVRSQWHSWMKEHHRTCQTCRLLASQHQSMWDHGVMLREARESLPVPPATSFPWGQTKQRTPERWFGWIKPSLAIVTLALLIWGGLGFLLFPSKESKPPTRPSLTSVRSVPLSVTTPARNASRTNHSQVPESFQDTNISYRPVLSTHDKQEQGIAVQEEMSALLSLFGRWGAEFLPISPQVWEAVAVDFLMMFEEEQQHKLASQVWLFSSAVEWDEPTALSQNLPSSLASLERLVEELDGGNVWEEKSMFWL